MVDGRVKVEVEERYHFGGISLGGISLKGLRINLNEVVIIHSHGMIKAWATSDLMRSSSGSAQLPPQL